MSHESDLNRAVNTFIALLALAATVVLLLSFFAGQGDGGNRSVVTAGLIAAGILAAQWFPIHLTDKTKVYVDTTVLIAAILLLPPAIAIVTAALASATHELTARVSWQQGVFNVGQSVVYVGAGAWTYCWLSGSGIPADLVEGRVLAAAGAGIVAMHLVNTAAVAVVAALQLERPVLAFWRDSLWIDLPEHLVLAINGVLLSIAADSYRWLLPLLAGPLVLIYLSLSQSAELRSTTRTMLRTIDDLNRLLAKDPAQRGRAPSKFGRSEAVSGFGNSGTAGNLPSTLRLPVDDWAIRDGWAAQHELLRDPNPVPVPPARTTPMWRDTATIQGNAGRSLAVRIDAPVAGGIDDQSADFA